MKSPLVFSDDDIKVTVKYNGILPDLFREKQGIVANGVLQANNEIVATEVLAKHDENYMPKEISEQSGQSSSY
jgi:cytochrome c-type biogenesis protein CcmE